MKIAQLIKDTEDYNLHSHTQFCDGRAPMADMAAAALADGMRIYGFSPHSPITVESPCNMSREDVAAYIGEADRLKSVYDGQMDILTSMEIDYLSPEWGPHIDYFQRMPLDYTIGSVHFVPTRDGFPVDCDGRYERFAANLRQVFGNDLRYVVERYFEQVLSMLERGGFDILGHLDKIAGNASQADPAIEEQHWYEALIDDVISHAVSAGVAIEINTKAYGQSQRMFPAVRWWRKALDSGLTLTVNSDAHYPDRITAGRADALRMLHALRKETKETITQNV